MHDSLDIAVIGGGVAGITAAYLLQAGHRVTLYEAGDYLGGHTHTVVVPDGPDAGTPVDTGFIVLNDRTYPLFNRLLARLGVATRATDMSFSYACRRTGMEYASRNLGALFAQRRTLFDPGHLHMLAEILRFNRLVRRRLATGRLAGTTLGRFLRVHGFGPRFRERYLIPMVAAIWSAPDAEAADFPMAAFARFFENHGLLTVTDQPQWRFVAGGSHRYMQAFARAFTGTLHLSAPVAGIRRRVEGVRLTLADGTVHDHDRVVIPAHADEALRLLEDPSPDERRLLSAWRYSRNRVILHTDPVWMPANRRAWASWNYLRAIEGSGRSPVTVTYHMNRLQRLATVNDYFVTLNPPHLPAAGRLVAEMTYHHPTYTSASLATQGELARLNGRRHTDFCGSYFAYGFHEDAVRSAVAVAARFGIEL